VLKLPNTMKDKGEIIYRIFRDSVQREDFQKLRSSEAMAGYDLSTKDSSLANPLQRRAGSREMIIFFRSSWGSVSKGNCFETCFDEVGGFVLTGYGRRRYGEIFNPSGFMTPNSC